MDSFQLEIVPVDDARKQVVRIIINGVDLIDRVREVEMPFAEQEGQPELAGAYAYIALRVLASSRHLLGYPRDEDYRHGDEIEILSCRDCGGSLCWPLVVRIESHAETIAWNGFRQPRRQWDHTGLGPFVFDRALYERELAKLTP